jgi:hypothetical protein
LTGEEEWYFSPLAHFPMHPSLLLASLLALAAWEVRAFDDDDDRRCDSTWNCNTCGSLGCTSCYNRNWQQYTPSSPSEPRTCVYCPVASAVLYDGLCYRLCDAPLVNFEDKCIGCADGYYLHSYDSCELWYVGCGGMGRFQGAAGRRAEVAELFPQPRVLRNVLGP